MPRPRKPEGSPSSDGYLRVTIDDPDGGTSRVYLHRVVLREKLGDDVQECRWCGRLLDWELRPPNPSALVVDHLDHDRRNNTPENLVPSCQSCNLKRRKDASGFDVG